MKLYKNIPTMINERVIKIALVLCVAVLGIGFFITFVSFIYRNAEYKYLPDIQKKKLNKFNSPTAWALYSLTIAITIGIIFINSFINMMTGFSNVGKQQDTLTQQQQQQEQQQQQDQTDSSQQ